MRQKPPRFDTAVEAFVNHTDMGQAEAEAYVSRDLDGLSRHEAAQALDKDPSTVDSQLQNARKKAELPPITRVDPRAETGSMERRAIEIWFGNDAMLRYVVREHDTGEVAVYEEVFAADDPASVHERYDIAVNPEDIEEAALESIAEYVNTYREDIEAVRKDWPHVFEAITLHEA